MSRPRFFCAELTPGVATLSESESRHALQSLRLRPGDEVTLFDGRGRLAHAILEPNDAIASHPRRPGGPKNRPARFAVARVLYEPPPPQTLTLLVAAAKGPRLSWMVEKLTELGTTRIVIVEFERSVVHADGAHADKLRRTALEACKQSQRVWAPEIECGIPLAALVPKLRAGLLLVAHPDEEAPMLSHRMHAFDFREKPLVAVVGPEGGLTESEVGVLRDTGGELVRLAPTILRIETAAVTLAANWAARQPG